MGSIREAHIFNLFNESLGSTLYKYKTLPTLIELQWVGGAQSTVRHKIGSPVAHVQTLQASEPRGVYSKPFGMMCCGWRH